MPTAVRVPEVAVEGQVHAFVATSGYNRAVAGTLTRLPTRDRAPSSVALAVDAFLDQAELAATTRRVYGASLASFAAGVGGDLALDDLDEDTVASWFTNSHRHAAPATWNRELATLRSAVAWWTRRGWLTLDPTVTLERHREYPDRTRALTRRQVESLWRRNDVALREKTLWRLLHETAARANEILALDIGNLDVASKRARVHSKGGAIEWVFWQTGAAQLLPRMLAGRSSGPVFLADRLPIRAAPTLDVDPGHRPGPDVLSACRGAVPGAHRLDPAPAAPLRAHPRGRGRHQPPLAPRPFPTRVGSLPGTLRTTRPRSRGPFGGGSRPRPAASVTRPKSI